MSEARLRYYDNEAADVSIVITDDDIARNVPSCFATPNDYARSMIGAAVPGRRRIGEIRITRSEYAPEHLIELWLEDD